MENAPNESWVNYIKGLKAQGYNDQQIANLLLQKGYQKEFVDQLLKPIPEQVPQPAVQNEVPVTVVTPETEAVQPGKPKSNKLLLAVGGVGILVIIIGIVRMHRFKHHASYHDFLKIDTTVN